MKDTEHNTARARKVRNSRKIARMIVGKNVWRSSE